MGDIGAFEAKNKLSALLDQVEQGAEITITRRGRAIARLVPAEKAADRQKARRAADNLIARGKGVTLGWLKVKNLVDEGRP